VFKKQSQYHAEDKTHKDGDHPKKQKFAYDDERGVPVETLAL
jgi:hypothetical protein